jgi:cytoskeleton protein RodZ
MNEPTMNHSPSETTPGALLKRVRHEKNLTVVDVASRLCLSAQFVEDIEQDNYSRMSARTYARGYILSYAHFLGIPESKILPTLANVEMNFAPPKNLIALENEKSSIYQPVEPAAKSRSNVMLWISIFVIIILIGLVVLWWRGPSAPVPSPNGGSTQVPIQPQSTAPAPAAPAQASAPATPKPAAPANPINLAPTQPALPAPTATVPAAPAPVRKPQAPNDQSVVQPSDLRASRDTSPTTGPELPAPRASTTH